MDKERINTIALNIQTGDIFTMLGTDYQIKHVNYDGLMIEVKAQAVLVNWRTQCFVTVNLHEFTDISVLR